MEKTEMGLEVGPGLYLHASVLQLEWEIYGDFHTWYRIGEA